MLVKKKDASYRENLGIWMIFSFGLITKENNQHIPKYIKVTEH
ncbi:hypothetical protein [Anabaena sp. AL09]|jgi:hypothetical protein|nr:hypothetical protein [Anabaena sp. AL09]